jgi:pantetheine-phosphate adenylyltransferase
MNYKKKMFNKVIIGGTFEGLHKGHRRILETGFQVGKKVLIGLTSDEFASRFRVGKVSSYEKRKESLENFLKKFSKPYEIIKIHDTYGIATLDPEVDCIVVSEETLLRAEEINAIRFKKGLDKLIIIVIPIVLATNGKPISSDRISAGKINAEGKLL